MKVYYFGCWGETGPSLCSPGQHKVHSERHATPWESHDAVLCPGYVRLYENGPQIEGEAALHHKGGWTALAFWDRSVDKRGGCNSVFFAEGTYGPAAVLEIAREHFPEVWVRFTFEVRVVGRPSEMLNTRQVCPFCGHQAFGAILDGWAHDPPGWFARNGVRACSVACVTKATAAVGAREVKS